MDYSELTYNEIIDDLLSGGFDPANLEEIDVLRYTDEYRQPAILVRELRKQYNNRNQPRKSKRGKARPQRTKGRAAATIVKELTQESLM